MMKAFSFLTILESLSKKLSILRTKMHSDNLRVDYESITSQLRVSRPFSNCASRRASFGLSRRVSHFAAILTILFTIGVGSVWGAEFSATEISSKGTTKNQVTCKSTAGSGDGTKCVEAGDDYEKATVSRLNSDGMENFIEISAADGYQLTSPITIAGVVENNNNKDIVIVYWAGEYDNEKGFVKHEVKSWPNRKTACADAVVELTFTEKIQTIRLYRKVNVNETNKLLGTSSGNGYTSRGGGTNLCVTNITASASSSGGGETPDPDPDQPGTGGDGDSDGCTKIFWFAKAADATAAGVENNTSTFSNVKSSSSSSNNMSGTIEIDGKEYEVTGRGDNGKPAIEFTVPEGKTATLYGLASSSGSSARTITLKSTNYEQTQQTAASSSKAAKIEFTNMSAGTYKMSWSDNGAISFLCLKLCPTCTAPTLSYAPTAVTKTFGDAAFTNTLTNTNSVAVTYSSTNQEVATVDANGQVTIVGAGQTTITASSAEQTVSGTLYCEAEASYTLTVNKANISPTLTYNPNSLAIGGTANPNLMGTGDGTVTYSSDNTSVVEVNSSTGVVTAKAEGTATITATIAESAKHNGGTATCQISVHCTAPTSVTISGAWDKFGGETISLTATATGGSGNYTYQWKHKGENIEGATEATYTKDNCTLEDGGNYSCVVSTGETCSKESSPFGLKVYTLECYTDGVARYDFVREGTAMKGSVQVTLANNKQYEFKINAGGGAEFFFGNNGTINADISNWTFEKDNNNVKLNSGLGGTFVFTIDYTDNGNVPKISVTYPRKTIYMKCGSSWCDASPTFFVHTWGNGDYDVKLIPHSCASGVYVAENVPAYNSHLVFTRQKPGSSSLVWEGENFWNKSQDITIGTNDQFTCTGWDNGLGTFSGSTYTPATYSITFNANGGGGSMTEVTGITCGEDRTLAENGFIRTGYNFAGWSTSANGDKAYDDKATISNITSNITLYAKWTANRYTVTWNPAGGNWGGNTDNIVQTYEYGAKINAPEKPSRTGYDFAEWDPTYDANETTMPAEDVTYTAQWREIAQTYNITYELGPEGWKGENPLATYTAGTVHTLPTIDNLTNENYGTFQGWYENNTFTGDAVTTIPADATGDKTYYAKWVYEIKFFEVVDEATDTDVENKKFTNPLEGSYPTTYTYGIGITLPELPAKDGYTAAGWYSQWCVYHEQTNGLGWVDACKFTALANDAYGNVNFAVKYTANKYTITWNANSGNVSPASSTYTYGGSTVALPTPTRDGYTFNGWFTAETEGTQITEIGTTNKPTSNVTYYAQWTKNATPDPEPEGDYCINLGLGEAPTTANGGIPSELNNVIVTLTSTGSKSTWSEDGYLNLGANDDYITFDFTNVGKITKVSFDVTIPNWAENKNKIEYKFNDAATYTEKTISSAAKEIITLDAPENTNKFTFSREAGTGTRISQICFTLAPTTPTPEGEAIITNTLATGTVAWNSSISTTDATNITNLTALAATSLTISGEGNTSNGGQTAKITGTENNKNTAEYMSLSFRVACGKKLVVSGIEIPVQPVTSNTNNFEAVLTDGTTTITGSINNVTNGTLQNITFNSYGELVGNVTLKLYAWGWDDGYRLGKAVKIYGTIEEGSTPAATITWNTQPANGQVGSADFAYAVSCSDGSAVTVTSADPLIATIVNGKLHYVAAGTTHLVASATDACGNEITQNSNDFTVTAASVDPNPGTGEEKYYYGQVAIQNGALVKEITNGMIQFFTVTGGVVENSTALSISSTPSAAGIYYNSNNLTHEELSKSSNWGSSSTANRYIQGMKFKDATTYTLKLGSKTAASIRFYGWCGSSSRKLTIGGVEYTSSSNKNTFFAHEFVKNGSFTGDISISGSGDFYGIIVIDITALPPCPTPELSDLEAKRVCPGSDVTWTASNTAELADGETIAYQWTKNSTVLSNNATLTLNDITEAAGGTYVVTATVSADGKASATATKEVTLTVTPATATPTITANANTIFAGNSVTLTATCASSEVTYQWYTCTDAEGNGESAIGAATNTTYTLTAGEAGTYYYKVIVTGDGAHSCGTAEKVYELVVKTPSAGCYDMIIFDSSKDQTIPAVDATGTEANTGASWANVGTSTSSGSCTYTYNGKTYKKGWKFVGGTTKADSRYIQFEIPSGYVGSLFMAGYITSTDRSVFISDNPTGSLVTKYAYIKPSATNVLGTASVDLPTGTYYVCATDAFLLTELSIEICSDVNCTDPQVTATVNNATVCEGTENVTFTATNYADGAEFQWQKKDGNTWTNINGATSATYTISSVTTAHAGQYRVIAEKGCKRMSEEIKLTVLTAPTFNTFATTASVMKGNALAISDVQATGATGYAWYKSADNTFNAAEDTKVGTSKDLLLAAASIPEAADQTFYLFCVASNSCGSVTSNAITVTVTPFIAEECATAGNEGERDFGFTNTSCSSITYGSKSAWETNSSKEYLTYTAPAGRYFATAKVTIAHTNNSKAVYGYSKDGGTTWTYEETSSAVPTAYTTITIELPADVNAFCIGRNMDGKGTGTGKFYLAEICFTYTTMCTETTLTVGSYNNEYNISTHMEFVEPTFTLKAGETTLEGQTLTYTSSNRAIATVDEDGNVTFEGMTGTVTITATFAGGEINETEYCACQATYTITVGCADQAPKIVAAAGTNLNGCNNSITLEAKMQDGTTAFADGTFQWYRDGVAIDGATSASYTVVRAGTYTVSRTYTCTTMSSNSAVVTNENVEPEVERLTPFQYYHVDKTYSNQMKGRHLFAVTSYGTLDGKRYHLTATRNGETLDLSSSTAFFTIPSSDNAVDTVMIDLNELKGKYSANDEIVITCAPINSCNNASAITASITIHVIDQTPTLALICSGADGEGTRETANLVVGGDFLTGYNKADLCQQTGGKTFDPNTEWGFYTELKEKYIVTPVNGYAEFNKLNYEPFDILLLTDYPKASKSEAAATILDDMAALCDYRPLLSLKAHMVAKSPSKWAAKGFTTSPVVPAATSQYANIVCYAHPMFDELDDVDVEGIYHDHDDFNQLVYQILTGPGHESSKGLQGFELKDADNFVTIGLIHYNAAAAVVTHDNHTHLEWTPAADDRQLVAIAERQANIEARMILFAINCGAQSMQTPMGRQVLLTCLDYLLKTDLIEVADCRLTFDNGEGNADFDPNNYEGTGTKGDGLWSTAANWGPEYTVVPGRNNDVRIAAPCTVDANEVEVLSVHITENGSLTIPADKSFTARSTILRADENGNVYPTNVEDISLGSNAGGNASLILNNERGDTKAGVAMYSKAKAGTGTTWQYIGTPHSDVQNATYNYYNSWIYSWNPSAGWEVVPTGGAVYPWVGYCITHPITHPEQGHTYWMEGTLVETTTQEIEVPSNSYQIIGNSWTAPIQIANFEETDFEGIETKTIYFFNTGTDPEGSGDVTANATSDARWAAGTYISVPIHAADYTGEDTEIPSMQGFYVANNNPTTAGTLHLDYERHVRAPRKNTPSGPMHAPARRVAADNEPQVAKLLVRGKRYDDKLVLLEREDFTRGYDSGWDGDKWDGGPIPPTIWAVNEFGGADAVSAIPEYEGTVIGFRAGEDSEYTIHFDYDGMEDALYLLDTDTQIYTRVLKGNSYTFTCTDKAEHNRFILTRKAPQIATGTEHINTGENAKAVKFIKDDKIFIFVNGTLYDATGKMVIR